MSIWVLAVAVPVALSTVVAVSACMLSSRRSRSLEMPMLRAAEESAPVADVRSGARSAPASPSSR